MTAVERDRGRPGKEALVTTIAPDTEKLRELEEETRQAWQGYHDQLQELNGDQYESAELEAWESLQGELARIEHRRGLLTAAV